MTPLRKTPSVPLPAGNVLGIDVGSVAVSFVEVDRTGEIVTRGYETHGGLLREAVAGLLADGVLERVRYVAATASTPDFAARSATYDPLVSAIAALRRLAPDARALMIVGGEKFSLTRLDRAGRFLDTRSNSSCAAGTGSFLDQQARTLGLANTGELALRALEAGDPAPRIASRCAVFAKTDLIHAQQEGHGLPEICAGLCEGLANIVADTLLAGDAPAGPVVLAGGVALNRAVVRHLEARLGAELVVPDRAPLMGSLGAALSLLADLRGEGAPAPRAFGVADLAPPVPEGRAYHHEPIRLEAARTPEFAGEQSYEFTPRVVSRAPAVEVDVYRPPGAGERLDAWLGLDVGSTSTKAVLLDEAGEVVAGFYTRTAGQPLTAVRGIFEAMESWRRESGLSLAVRGAGTTGSGRKLAGSVIGADRIVDEITAHARAAYELDPAVDTIIEIGGQDAKFTTLRNGMVTAAVMNTVCAAGTGSFIEEQARQLGRPLSSFADEVAGARAPLGSSRCTVFMQRDVNHLVSRGYAVSEVLATVLHAVCENYLSRVARESRIGERICFQGATAKNPALVAVFEQRLGRPIRVSRYCHLTGALGTALLLKEEGIHGSSFRGIDLYADAIPVRSETCDLCRNHCKIVLAEVRGETASCGFVCGREPDTERRHSGNRSGFDLLRARARLSREKRAFEPGTELVAGLPTALFMAEEFPFWRSFFRRLGVRVVSGESCPDPVGTGLKLARAEFCAPMAAWHGQVSHLLGHADFVFAPTYLEARHHERDLRRHYCYYSQFAGPLVDTFVSAKDRGRVLRPLVLKGVGDIRTLMRIHSALRPVLGRVASVPAVTQAYLGALGHARGVREKLYAEMREELASSEDVSVVLLGRPYTALSRRLNKGIPDLLASLGVKVFFQDMLSFGPQDTAAIDDLLRQVHWHFEAKILEAAYVTARTDGLYPVFVSSFKCGPDSFGLEFFRRILDERGKPYLVLELDEHESSVGYETRIEAAVRSFQNHNRARSGVPAASLPVVPRVADDLDGRVLFLPSWDRLSCGLIAANLRREGVEAHLLTEDELTIRKSQRENSGQCIPLNAVVEGFVDTVRRRGLEPAKTVLWMIAARVSCNIGMYPAYAKALLEARGGGFEEATVYAGDLSGIEISARAALNNFFAFMFGGMLRRMACRVRPYEVVPGSADAAVEAGLARFIEMFENGRPKLEAVREVVDRFAAVETRPGRRPLVAIFGDLYVRDNDVFSQDLGRFIERHGGEVITTPYSEYVKIIADTYLQRWFKEGRFIPLLVQGSLLWTARTLERQYAEEFARVIGPLPRGKPAHSPAEILARYGVTDRHNGESMDNLLKIHRIVEEHPDVSLFVQANPAFCCPSLVTEAMAERIREEMGVPVVTVTYDGTGTPRNEEIIPYLQMAAVGEA